MPQTVALLKELGRLGLLERLDDQTREQGVLNHQILIDLVRDKEYERVQGIGDDFIPDINLYNAVGAIYPLLDEDQKVNALDAHLNQLDGVNNRYITLNHTPFIREPLLLADITIARPLYWPGLNDEKSLWDGKESFAELEREIMVENGLFNPNKVKSDFLVAYALMRRDLTSFGEDYVKAANPQFLDRVIKGIVDLRFKGTKDEQKINEGRARLYELLPQAVHDRIEPLRQETARNYVEASRA